MNYANIKSIIFDLGGVILNINYALTEKAFRKLGVSDFASIYSQAAQDRLFDAFETGDVTEDEFRRELCAIAKITVTPDQFDKAWNAMLLDLPARRISFIKKLRENRKCFVLSNTNSIHIRAFLEIVESSVTLQKFEDAFDKVYYSYKMRARKPDPEAFQLILSNHELEPAETLFIDDSAQHIQGAKLVGLQALLLEPSMNIVSLLQPLVK